MFEILVLVLQVAMPILVVLATLSMLALRSSILDCITPTHQVRQEGTNAQFVGTILERIGCLDDLRDMCNITESGIFTKHSKPQMEIKLTKLRGRKYMIRGLIFGLVTIVVFKSLIISGCVLLLMFMASLLDRLMVKVAVNNPEFLLEE